MWVGQGPHLPEHLRGCPTWQLKVTGHLGREEDRSQNGTQVGDGGGVLVFWPGAEGHDELLLSGPGRQGGVMTLLLLSPRTPSHGRGVALERKSDSMSCVWALRPW